jgi:hypothetical protein
MVPSRRHPRQPGISRGQPAAAVDPQGAVCKRRQQPHDDDGQRTHLAQKGVRGLAGNVWIGVKTGMRDMAQRSTAGSLESSEGCWCAAAVLCHSPVTCHVSCLLWLAVMCCVQTLAPDTYRLRLLNGCNSRVLQLRFGRCAHTTDPAAVPTFRVSLTLCLSVDWIPQQFLSPSLPLCCGMPAGRVLV